MSDTAFALTAETTDQVFEAWVLSPVSMSGTAAPVACSG